MARDGGVVAALVPLWWSIEDARSLTGRDPRLDAAAWIDAHVPARDRIAADPSTLPLAGRDVVRLELPGPGRPFDRRRDLTRLRGAGVEWVVVGGVVTDRVLEPPALPAGDRLLPVARTRLRPAFATRAQDGRRDRPWVRVYGISTLP